MSRTLARRLATLLLSALAVQAAPPAVEAAVGVPAVRPDALALLREADAALRETDRLAYRLDYVGLGINPGRFVGDVTLRRASSAVRWDSHAELEVLSPLPSLSGPVRFDLTVEGGRVARLDRDAARLERMTSSSGGHLGIAQGYFLYPQLLRDPPYAVELQQPRAAARLGRSEVGGEPCDLLSLSFPPDTGLGEQLFCFGVEDRLPRSIAMTAPVSESELFGFEMRMTRVRTGEAVPEIASLSDLEPPAGVELVDLDRVDLGVGAPSPAWSLKLAGGGGASSEQLAGQVVVLDFWTTWCPACRTSLPRLARLDAELAGRPVRILAVNFWDGSDPMDFIEAEGLDLEVGLDGDRVAETFRVAATPTVVVIGPDGRIAYRESGAAAGREERLRAAIEQALPEGPSR